MQEYEKDLASIRTLMERSVKFVSLSGLSGALAGLYALIGSGAIYALFYYPFYPYGLELNEVEGAELILTGIPVLVLIGSITTAIFLSMGKAKKLGVTIWNNASRQLMLDLMIPLVTGGLLILISILQEYFLFVAPAVSLIFYGLALVQAARNTYREILYLGFTEIILGLLCAAWPDYGLIFWASGFGVMHIIYGSLVYYRYDR